MGKLKSKVISCTAMLKDGKPLAINGTYGYNFILDNTAGGNPNFACVCFMKDVSEPIKPGVMLVWEMHPDKPYDRDGKARIKGFVENAQRGYSNKPTVDYKTKIQTACYELSVGFSNSIQSTAYSMTQVRDNAKLLFLQYFQPSVDENDFYLRYHAMRSTVNAFSSPNYTMTPQEKTISKLMEISNAIYNLQKDLKQAEQ